MTAPALEVRHTAGRYPVYIGAGLLAETAALARSAVSGRPLALIADAAVLSLHGAELSAACRPVLSFPAGEASKSRREWARLTDELLAAGTGRDGAIVTLGGGTAGDLGGFVAATYLRGIPYVQCPTTLLAMIDASVGGKTGVDTDAGKNLVGAFHQPSAVVTDPLVLGTLPEPDFRSGFAEAVKHALVADAEQLGWLEEAAQRLLERDPALLTELITRSVAIKSAIVASDEHERGLRAVLNAGHTVAHALEAALGYRIRHGEAVAIGLVAETRVAAGMGLADPALPGRVSALLARFGLPVAPPEPVPDEAFLAALQADKKNRNATVRCALIAAPGKPVGGDGGWTTGVEPAALAGAVTA